MKVAWRIEPMATEGCISTNNEETDGQRARSCERAGRRERRADEREIGCQMCRVEEKKT